MWTGSIRRLLVISCAWDGDGDDNGEERERRMAAAVETPSDPSSSTAQASALGANVPPLADLVRKSAKRARVVYRSDDGVVDEGGLERASVQAEAGQEHVLIVTGRNKLKLASKLATEYKDVLTLPPALAGAVGAAGPKRPAAIGPAAAGPAVKMIEGAKGSAKNPG